MPEDRSHFVIREHCHINHGGDGDSFVGIKADSNNVMVYFPIGYDLPADDDELVRDIKNLFRVLATFSEKSDRVLEEDKFTEPQAVEFPIHAYINVINYYLDHNGSYYTETETTHKVDSRGKTNWARTIKTQKPMVQNKSILYLNQVVRKTTPNLNQLITRIHKYCVYKSFERIGWLFTTTTPEQPDITFDSNLFLATLNTKLNNTNNDNEKKLFRSMIAMIEFKDSHPTDKQLYYGTEKFEIVWERLIDKVFGIPDKDNYLPHGLWTERYGKNSGKTASALIPDTVMVYDKKYYVLDAKYYRYGILSRLETDRLPQSSDINKQITYGQFVKTKRAPKESQVFNAFIMPYNRYNNLFGINSIFGNVAEATGDWVNNPGKPEQHERIQGIVFDTRYLLKNYDGNHDSIKKELCEAIEHLI